MQQADGMKTDRFVRRTVVAVVWIGVSLTFAPAEAGRLFETAERSLNSEELQYLESDSLIVPGRYRLAQLDSKAFTRTIDRGSPLHFNLFDGLDLRANVASSRRLESGSRFHSGSLEGGGHFTLLLHHTGIVRGSIHSPLGTYTVKSHGDDYGLVLIRKKDLSNVDLCGVGEEHIRAADEVPSKTQIDPIDGEATQLSTKQYRLASESEPIDVLVVYTQRVEDYEGGPEQVEAMVENDVERMNQALENSGLANRVIRLAALEKVDYAQNEEKGLGRDNLNLIRTSAHNYNDNDYSALDEVHTLAEQHRADLIHLFVRDSLGACGYGTIYNYDDEEGRLCKYAEDGALCVSNARKRLWKDARYSVSAAQCAGGEVFAHEIGHTLALWHQRGDYDWEISLGPFRPYAFGYTSPDHSHRICQYTVMSVRGCPADGIDYYESLPYFSNPDLPFPRPGGDYAARPFNDNTPMGVPGNERVLALEGPVNAAKAIDDVWDVVANLSEPDDVVPPPIRNHCNVGDIPPNALSGVAREVGILPGGETKRLMISFPVPENCSGIDLWARSSSPFVSTVVQRVRDGEFELSISADANNACDTRKAAVSVEVYGVGGVGVDNAEILLSQASSNALCRGVSEAPDDSTTLDFSGRNRSGSLRLLGGMFSRFTDLQRLDLSDNGLSRVERSIFDGLDGLTELNLSHNLLTVLPDYAFAELSGLETLSLNDNRIGGDVTHLSFWGAQQLKVLNLSRNALTGLADDAFEENKNLESLWLQSNDIARIHADALDGLSELKLLSLSRNELTELPEDTFVDLTSLEHLWLYGNRLSDLPDGLFSGLSNLTTLSLSGNDLTDLGEGLFSDLASLEQLWLLDNGITAIASGTFEGLSSVRSLSLSGNDLTSLPNRAFSETPNLEALWLYGNGISEIAPNAFDGLASLRYLDISNNPLSAPLPAKVCSFLRNAETLRAEGLQMETICPQ